MGLLSPRRDSDVATSPPAGGAGRRPALDFEIVYEQNFKYVWRAARRLGIDSADTDDIVQEVFVVAHRRMGEFEGRAQPRTWLYRILVHVVRHYFRARRRKPGHRVSAGLAELAGAHDTRGEGPAEAVERADAARVLDRLLAQLDPDKREVFVLAEVEELSSVEIAEILGANVNTIYSRLRVARQEFERALERFHRAGGENERPR
jgi:RNA polymerase sigma-70 factor (ECF subfamily)